MFPMANYFICEYNLTGMYQYQFPTLLTEHRAHLIIKI